MSSPDLLAAAVDQEPVPVVPLLNFRRISHGWAVQAALDEIAEHEPMWDQITARQTYPGSAHTDTQTIFIRGPRSLQDAFECLESVSHACPLHETWALIRRLHDLLQPQETGRILLVRLRSGGRITRHTDEGRYAEAFTRFHLVLSSSRWCEFHCGAESVQMRPGEVWWFNHREPHAVLNWFGTPRIHLIIDIRPGPDTPDTGRQIDISGTAAPD